ncbi:hypothetical protein IFR05_010586 [Cadophora sp. M221]|nr:hypothetical protein IFR05_010586 [Cadophora sp. M221]
MSTKERLNDYALLASHSHDMGNANIAEHEDGDLFSGAVMVTPQRKVSKNPTDLSLDLQVARRKIDILQSEARTRDMEIKRLRAVIRKQAEELNRHNVWAQDIDSKGKSYENAEKVTSRSGGAVGSADFAVYLATALGIDQDRAMVKGAILESVESFVITREEVDALVQVIIDVGDFLSDPR